MVLDLPLLSSFGEELKKPEWLSLLLVYLCYAGSLELTEPLSSLLTLTPASLQMLEHPRFIFNMPRAQGALSHPRGLGLQGWQPPFLVCINTHWRLLGHF